MTRQHLWCVGRVYLLFQDFLLWREGGELFSKRLGDQRFVEAFVHRDPASVEAGVKCAALGLAYVSLHATAGLWPTGDLSSLRRLIAIPRTTNQEVHPDHRDQPGGDCRSDRALPTEHCGRLETGACAPVAAACRGRETGPFHSVANIARMKERT